MSVETLSSSEVVAYDQEWFEQFQKIGSFQAHVLLDGNKGQRNEAKDSFLKDTETNPTLDYPHIKKEDLNSKISALKKLKEEIKSAEKREELTEDVFQKIQEAYFRKINVKIAEAKMLIAAKNGESEKFTKYSKFLYQQPTKGVFQYIVKGITDLAPPEDEKAKAALGALKEEFNHIDTSSAETPIQITD